MCRWIRFILAGRIAGILDDVKPDVVVTERRNCWRW